MITNKKWRLALAGLALVAVPAADVVLSGCTPAQWRAAQNWNDTTPKADPYNHCTWHWRIDHYVPSGWRDRNGNEIFVPYYRWVCDPNRNGGYN
jgi:hypothetical protein